MERQTLLGKGRHRGGPDTGVFLLRGLRFLTTDALHAR